MKKDMIFFSADGNGLTSTSANHIANLAKEKIREIETALARLTLYSTSVALIGNDTVNIINEGDTIATLDMVKSQLHTIAKAHSLIAWLREAIKAKERLLTEVEDLSADDYLKLQGIEKPKMPEKETALTEDEYYASLSIDERNRYYSLEALASVLGKAVHPGGRSHSRRPRAVERENQKTKDSGGQRTRCPYICLCSHRGSVASRRCIFRLAKRIPRNTSISQCDEVRLPEGCQRIGN